MNCAASNPQRGAIRSVWKRFKLEETPQPSLRIGTARACVVYAFDRWLPYVTGGVVYGNIQPAQPAGTSTNTNVGWTAGAGLEYAIDHNWSAKLEYLHVDLGTATFMAAASGAANLAVPATNELARVGANYRWCLLIPVGSQPNRPHGASIAARSNTACARINRSLGYFEYLRRPFLIPPFLQIIDMVRPVAHQAGGFAQCDRLPVRGEFSHDINRCTCKVVCQH